MVWINSLPPAPQPKEDRSSETLLACWTHSLGARSSRRQDTPDVMGGWIRARVGDQAWDGFIGSKGSVPWAPWLAPSAGTRYRARSWQPRARERCKPLLRVVVGGGVEVEESVGV